MILDLPTTTTSAINRQLVDLRESGGAIALGRVLTLVICTDDSEAEEAIEAANDASREHPCRVLVLARGSRRGASRLDAQVRVGGDAGASEVVVLRLYGELADHGDAVVVPLLLPDAPVVVWWPGRPPADPAADPVGAMAQRRITDSSEAARPRKALDQLASSYAEGDTDLAWTRLTLWRGLLAAALDQAPFEKVTSVVVSGSATSPSTDLLAGWLARALRCPVTRARTRAGAGITGVRLERASGPVELSRPEGSVALLTQPGQPDRRLALPRRAISECLAEELRRLDPDVVYADALTAGLRALDDTRTTRASTAARAGEVAVPKAAARRARAVDDRGRKRSAAMKRGGPATRRTPGQEAPR